MGESLICGSGDVFTVLHRNFMETHNTFFLIPIRHYSCLDYKNKDIRLKFEIPGRKMCIKIVIIMFKCRYRLVTNIQLFYDVHCINIIFSAIFM